MGANSSSHHHHEPLGANVVNSGPTNGGGYSAGQPQPMSRRKSLRKSLKRHKKQRPPEQQVEKRETSSNRRMDRLRRSFRDSFRKKKDPHIPEASKPHQWVTDEESVKAGTCHFAVKYLGCVEVFESRGMHVCEEALKVLRISRRRPIRSVLHVSGDGLRVVDDETKDLIVDQTIEKVSFCAPDRNHDRGFSYICRDGTTRRWMCHGFVAVKETGERLSHAVGCAFASCLERKQKRDKECGVTMSFDQSTSTFTRVGSFKQMSLTERISDPQDCKPSVEPPVKKVDNPHAIARPHATPLMLQRQGSFRVFQHLNQSSPFKRQLSLRLNDLPSNLERTRSMSLDNSVTLEDSTNISSVNNNIVSQQDEQPVTPIPESSPVVEGKADPVSEFCKEMSAGLSALTNLSDPFGNNALINPGFSAVTSHTNPALGSPTGVLLPSVQPIREENPWSGATTIVSTTVNGSTPQPATDTVMSNASKMSRGEEWLAQLKTEPLISNGTADSTSKIATSSAGTNSGIQRRNPPLSQLRSLSLGTNATPSLHNAGSSWMSINGDATTNGTNMNHAAPSRPRPGDPFDAEWAALASRNVNPNNPFLQTTVTKAFEVQM